MIIFTFFSKRYLHVMMLDEKKGIYMVGSDQYGQIGAFPENRIVPNLLPQTYFDNNKIIDIGTMEYRNFAIDEKVIWLFFFSHQFLN